MEEKYKKESYQYIWWLLTNIQGLSKEKIRFKKSSVISPYFELNSENLNEITVDDENNDYVVEMNPFMRFSDVYHYLLHPDYVEIDKKLRESLLNITLHLLGNFDLYEGQTKKDIFCKEIVKNILSGRYGEKVSERTAKLKRVEQLSLAEVIYDSQQNVTTINCLKKIMKKFFENSIVYDNLYSEKNIVLFIGEEKTEESKNKYLIIKKVFIPLGLKVKVFWKHHFGILGNEETMILGEMTVY